MRFARWYAERPVALYAVAVILFVIGWSKFLVPGYGIYGLDYAFRVTACGVVAFGGGARGAFVRPPDPRRALALGIAAFLTMILCDVGYFGLMAWTGWRPTAGYPLLYNAIFEVLDLSLGLFLVAVSEELVFRHVAARALNRPGASWIMRDLLPAAVFGFVHLPQGGALMIGTAAMGVVLMRLYRATGSLWPSILVHLAFDILVFSGAGCPIRPGMCVFLP